jgi:GT2 family glycosyltransferase
VALPEISVITVTRDRLEILLQKFETLKDQSLDMAKFEWVVCVNGCQKTLDALNHLHSPFKITIESFAENRGVSVARNMCVARSQAKVVYFSDDDVLLKPETLQEHVTFHQRRDSCVAVGGVDWEYQGQVETMRPKYVNYWNLHGMNTSLPKEAFEAVGGFPEWLTGYGHEDVLLGYQLVQKGYRLVALPDVVVRHIGANPMRGLQPDKARQAGQNAVQIIRRYPTLAFRLGVHPILLGLKRLALHTAVRYLWKIIDKESYAYERAYLEGALEEMKHV